jgi:hypothetical protein
MAELKPLRFNRFVEVLYLLDLCIPFIPSEPDREFMIFRDGATGYFPRPSGARCAFVTKEPDALVPALEIAKTIRILGVTIERFLEVSENCQIPESPETTGEGLGQPTQINASTGTDQK